MQLFSLLIFHSTRYVRLTDSKANLKRTNIQCRHDNIYNICGEIAYFANIQFRLGNLFCDDIASLILERN